LADSGYYVGPVIDEHTLLVAVTEKRTREHYGQSLLSSWRVCDDEQ